MLKRLLLPLILALSLFAVACGGTEETTTADAETATTEAAEETAATEAPETTTEAPTTTAAPETTEAETTTAAPETTEAEAPEDEAGTEAEDGAEADAGAEAGEIDGQAIFESNCARCHGADGSGGRGPTLIGIADKRDGDTSDVISLVTNGGRQMPSFGDDLSEDEVVAVVDYAFSAWPAAASS